MNGLDSAIRDAGAAAYAAYGSSADAGVLPDPVPHHRPRGLHKETGRARNTGHPQMEHERAVRESSAAVVTRADAGYLEYIKAGEPRWRATAHMIADLAAGPVLVPATFPLALARELESFHPVVLDAAGTVEGMRAVKTQDEIEQIRSVQRATEAAMERGIALIRASRSKGGILHLDDRPLTAEAVRAEMHTFLLTQGCRGLTPSSPAAPTPPSRTTSAPGRSWRTNRSSSTSSRRTNSPATTPT